MEATLHQDYNSGVLPAPPETISTPSLLHGQRRKGGLRARKSVDDYVAQYNGEFSSQTLNKDGRFLEVLVCNLCNVVVGGRSDRIKEHLNSRRHQKSKSEKPTGMLHSEVQPMESPSFDMGKKIILGPNMQGEQKQNGSFESNESNKAQTIPNVIASTTLLQKQTGIIQNSGPAISGPKEGLKIQWNGFDSNIRAMCKGYLHSTDFSDVTLWVEGKPIKCHRLILAAASPYFQKLFREFEQHGCSQEIIIPLLGFRFSDVQTILEFIYNGEFEVRNEDFQSILGVAVFFEIQCLMELDQQNKIPRVSPSRGGNGRANNAQTEVGSTMDGNVKSKVKAEIVELNNRPKIDPVPESHTHKPMSMNPNPGFNFNSSNHVNSTNCVIGANYVGGNGHSYGHNGHRVANAYNNNHVHHAGMMYNPVGLNRGVVDLMTGFWDRQQVPNLPYTDYSEFRPMNGNSI